MVHLLSLQRSNYFLNAYIDLRSADVVGVRSIFFTIFETKMLANFNNRGV